MLLTLAGKVTAKSRFTDNDFCQFYREFQVHELGLGLWVGLGLGLGMVLGTKSRCLWVGFCQLLSQQSLPDIERIK